MSMEIKLYRHIYHKDIYLCRNWQYCGGGETTPFYFASRDLMQALKDANRAGFLSWKKTIPNLVAKIIDTKEVDIDGYKGNLQKELAFPVAEFECVTFVEG
jgi:hypothetical protein